MQAIRSRSGVQMEAGREIGLPDLPKFLANNQRLVDEVSEHAEGIAVSQIAHPVPIDPHIPSLNARNLVPALADATVERSGKAIYVNCISNRISVVAYHFALDCLLKAEKNIPGKQSAWLDAPAETSGSYKPIYGFISRVLQERLRKKLPNIWFSYPGAMD